jgi:thioredoxin-like negative regulator of GroEL
MRIPPRLQARLGDLALGILLLAPGAAYAQTADPAAGAPAAAQAGGMPAVIATLLSQAQYWQAQHQPQQSLDSLRRLLALDPTNTDALALRAQIELAQGDTVAASQDLATLRQLQPQNTQIPALAQMQHEAENPVDTNALAAARSAAQTGKYASAVNLYNQSFHGSTPPTGYGVEYYETLAGTPNGWPQAIAGLEALVAANPSDLQAQLAFASVQTYQPQTRETGISRLASLTAFPSVAPAAASAWKQALAFLPEDPSSIPMYQAYLAKYPNDPTVQNLVAAANAPQPVNPANAEGNARAQGFAALKADQLSQAAAYFQTALASNPNDADALGGLGLVRLRQGETGQAQKLLRQAIAANPSEQAQWQAALTGAARGADYHTASALIAQGDLDRAAQVLHQIIAGGGDITGAEKMLADVDTKRGDAAGAETEYRAVLARDPNNGPALVGLATLLEQQGDTQDAQNLFAQAQANGQGALVAGAQASALRAQAQAANNPTVALALYQAAVTANPSDPWARLDLARALKANGQDGQARAQMDSLLAASSPPSIADLQAAALFAEADGRPADAAALVAQLPPSGMTPDMLAIQNQGALAQQINNALAQGAGNPALTRQLLVTMAAAPDPSGNRGAAIATALVNFGDPQGAQLAIQTAIAANPGAGAQAQLTYAGAMLGAGQDLTAAQIVQSLQARGGLTPDQQATIVSLRDGLAVRASDKLAQQGRLAEAYNQLAPGLAQSPSDPSLNTALARLYLADHQPKQALAIDTTLLQADPNNLDARDGAINAAIAIGDIKTANALVQAGQTNQPNEPRIWLMAANLATAQGDNGTALSDLQTAQALRQQQLVAASGGSPAMALAAAAPVSVNPFGNGGTAGSNAASDAGPSVLSGQPGVYTVAPSQTDPLTQQIAKQINTLQQTQTAYLQGGISVESRSGSTGLDQLETFGTPIIASFSPRGVGQLSLTATPTFLLAGQLSNDATSQSQFGSDALGVSRGPESQSAAGVGLDAAYQLPWLKANIGGTPFGFRTQNLIGGVELDPKIGGGVSAILAVSRAPVTDSLLSYASTVDPRSETLFGGVLRDRVNAQLTLAIGPGYVYLGGGADQLSGKHVEKNSEIEFGAGGAYPIFQTDASTTTAGVNVTYFSYAKNLDHFTLGNGGYFSPQSYFAVTVPLDYKETDGALTWDVGGTAGVQSYTENTSAYFPEDPTLQSQLEAKAANSTVLQAFFPGSSNNGIVGGAHGSFEYALNNTFIVGGKLTYDRTANWNDTLAFLYARYLLGGAQ